MRKQATWMAKWDDRLLEYLYENGPSTPGKIADDDYIRVSTSYISQRLSTLQDNQMVTNLGNGVYQITDEGAYYLAGGYDPENGEYLHETDPERGIKNYERMGIYMNKIIDKVPRE